MKVYKVKFSNDHFIEIDTNNVITPVNGREYLLIGEDGTFSINLPISTIGKSLDSDAKEAKMLKKYGKSRYRKILLSGTKLYFRTGKPGGDNDQEYIFQCQLLEDQYLFLIGGREGKEPESWRLCKCNCQLEKCLNKKLEVYQKLQADSLNSLYTKTVMHFFSERLSGSANALTTFFPHDNEKEITWFEALNDRYQTLNKIRIQVAKVYPEDYEISIFVSEL